MVPRRPGRCCSSCSPTGCPPGGRFLDLGAGTGATGAWLAEHGDSSPPTSSRSRSTLHRERHPASEVVACDAGALPFADASFDAVLCVTVLCHRSIESPVGAVGEMARVVRPGGLVCLWEPGVRRLRRAHDRVTHTGRRFSRRDLAELLTANGLHVERSTGAYSFLVPPAAVKTVLERGETSSDLDRNAAAWAARSPAAARRAPTAAAGRPARRSVGRRRRPPRRATMWTTSVSVDPAASGP